MVFGVVSVFVVGVLVGVRWRARFREGQGKTSIKMNAYALLQRFTGELLDALAEHPTISAAELRELGEKFPAWARVVVDAQAFRRDATGLDLKELARMAQDLMRLSDAAEEHPEVLQTLALSAGALIPATAAAGYMEIGFGLGLAFGARLDELEPTSVRHGNGVRLSRFLLLEGVYDWLNEQLEQADVVTDDIRQTSAQDMLRFVDGPMTSAFAARAQILRTQPNLAVELEIRRCERAMRHRRLSWASAVSVEKGQAPTDRVAEWKTLHDEYAGDGDRRNALAALSNGLERYVEVVERTPERRGLLADAITELCPGVEAEEQAAPDRLFALDVKRVAIRARLALQDKPSAATAVGEALDEIVRLGGTDDDFRRSFVLRRGEDWVGLSIRATEIGSQLHGRMHEVIRGAPRIAAVPKAGESAVRPILTRPLCIYEVDGAAREENVQSAHELARTLDKLHRFAAYDIATVAASESEWRGLLDRLAGQSRVAAICGGLTNVQSFVLGGTALHLPWTGLLVHAGIPADVALSRCEWTLPTTGSQHTPKKEPWLVVNAFDPAEQWSKALEAIVAATGARHERPHTPEEMRAALTLPAQVIVLGCHGDRSTFGELRMSVGGRWVRAEELLGQATMRDADVAFCAVCFAGGGMLSALGDWSSLPGLLLKAGVGTIVANQWPVWDWSPLRTGMITMLTDIAKTQRAPVQIGAVVMRWLRGLRGEHPRYWSGWGVWTGMWR